MPSPFKSVAKCIISPISTTLAVIGIGMLVFGLFGKTLVNQFLPTLLDSVTKSLSSFGTSFGNSSSLQETITTKIDPVYSYALYLGATVTVVGVSGLIAVCTGNSTLLRLYGVLSIIITVVFAIAVVQVTNGSIEKDIKTSLKKTIQNYYVDLFSTELYSIAWNAFMLLFRCCGVDDFGDFNDTLHWNRTITVKFQNYSKSYYQVSPIICCSNLLQQTSIPIPDFSGFSQIIASITSLPTTLSKIIDLFNPNSTGSLFEKLFENFNESCSAAPDTLNSNYMTGCWAKSTSFISNNTTYINLALWILASLPAAIGVIAILASIQCGVSKLT